MIAEGRGLDTPVRDLASKNLVTIDPQESLEEAARLMAKHQVRRMKAYGARMIKVYQQPRRSQRIYFAEACRDEKMLLTAEGVETQQQLSILRGFGVNASKGSISPVRCPRPT